nr:MAG TPA: hypothetical protein [Caudoviricetes sp.]
MAGFFFKSVLNDDAAVLLLVRAEMKPSRKEGKT